MGQAEEDPDLRPARQSPISPMFNTVAGKVEVGSAVIIGYMG